MLAAVLDGYSGARLDRAMAQGADRLAELRRVVAHAFDQGPARPCAGVVVGDRFAGDDLCFHRRQYVPVRTALLRNLVGAGMFRD